MVEHEMTKQDINFFNKWHWTINTYLWLTTCKVKNPTVLSSNLKQFHLEHNSYVKSCYLYMFVIVEHHVKHPKAWN